MPLVFEWDQRNAEGDLRKHRVSSAEAALVFSEPLARIFVDEDHSAAERREIIIGHSKRLLVVCFTDRAKGRIRIISARGATRGEQQDYEEHVTD
ncbi:MAG: BrnT family toxin [Acidobacteria bacterium]|nr:BrnT family toxin [Acidobacteriota bacterium]